MEAAGAGKMPAMISVCRSNSRRSPSSGITRTHPGRKEVEATFPSLQSLSFLYRLKYTAAFSSPIRVRAHRFWVLQDVGHCEGDVCWRELALPFTHPGGSGGGVTTGDDVSLAALWAMILSFLGTAVLVITRAYW